MLRKLIYTIAGLVVAALVVYAALSVYSRRPPPLGLADGKLRSCPDRPNCACSETATANVQPLTFSGPAQPAWQRFADAVVSSGGKVSQVTPDYLHATFESTYFRFVDDLEARLDAGANVIHVRSASRVGYADRGVNLARIDKLRAAWQETGN